MHLFFVELQRIRPSGKTVNPFLVDLDGDTYISDPTPRFFSETYSKGHLRKEQGLSLSFFQVSDEGHC